MTWPGDFEEDLINKPHIPESLYSMLVDAIEEALREHLDPGSPSGMRGCCADIAAIVAVRTLKDMGSLREDWPEI